MSAEALYQAVTSGRVKLSDLNDDGKGALRDYMNQKYPVQGPPDISGPLQGPPNLSDTEQGPPDVSTHETFLQNPLPLIGHKILGLLGLPEDTAASAINRFSSSLDASLTPKGPDITSDPNQSLWQNVASGLQYVDSPTAYDQAAQRVQQYDTGSPTLNKVADVAGGMASYVAPIPGMNPIINDAYSAAKAFTTTRLGNKIEQTIANDVGPSLTANGINLSDNAAYKIGQHLTQGTIAGGFYGATQPFVSGYGQMSEVPGSVMENALMFGVGDAAIPFTGAAAGTALQPLVTTISNRRGLNNAVQDFIAGTQKPADAVFPTERNVSDRAYPYADNSAELASNFNTKDQFKNEHDQAVQDQYDYLKQSMANRGGVDQGGVIKDPVTGEVIDRYGRISNNPKWYQDFYAEHGRAPTQKDLEGLAKKQVDNGYQEDTTQVPSFRPKELDEIDQQLAEINQAMPHADAESRQSLMETANILQTERDRLSRLMPEGPKPKESVSSPNEGARTTFEEWKKQHPDTQLTMDEWDRLRSILKPNFKGTLSESDMQLLHPEQLPKPIEAPEILKKEPIMPINTQPQAMKANDAQAYAGNSIPFRQTVTQTDRTISRNQVINGLRKNLGVVIDTGRLSSKGSGVLGEFKATPEVIRSRMQGDIQVISHEVGHNLDKRFGLSDPQYRQELTNMVNQVNPGHLANYQPHQHLEEAIAEYVRLRLTDPDMAKQLAPNFTRFFEQKVSKKALQGLETSTKDINTWITQGEYEQAKGLIDFTSGTKKEPFSRDKWYTRYVDDLNPLKLAEKALKGAVGIGKDSIYKMARLSRGISQRAELAVTRGIFENGQKVGEGLQEIVKPLEEAGIKEKDFSTYLSVVHAQDLKVMGKRVPFSDAQINAVMQKLGNNLVVQAAQKKIVEYNNHLMDVLVDAQIISQQAANDMRQKYPNYVPFMRYFDDDAVAGFKNGGFGASKGFANIANPVKKMSEEGSLRDIVNPIESMVKNTFLVMNAAAKNKVGLQLAELSKIDGAGAWVEHVGEGGSSPHEHIISVYQNGERQSYKVRNPELYNAMLSLDAESSNSLIRFLGGAASLLRGGATLTPDFMIRNMMRDVIGNTVNATKYGFNPLTIFNGLYHMVKRDTGVFDQFISSGGAMGTLMSLDREANREAMKAVFKASLADKAMNVITSPKELTKMLTGITPLQKTVGLLRKGSEISELTTRVGAFNKVLKKTGSAEEAAYEARDLMDFNRAGSAIRPANKGVAFLNANIQGVDRMRRAFLDNKTSFLVRAFTTLVMPAASVYMWNKNLPDEQQKLYENIPQWQKDSFFVIGIPGTDQFLRIPKPFEAGMIFATGTERVLRSVEDNDPDAFKGYESSIVQALTPPTMITALTPILEAITNYSFFRNAPIVPQGEQRFEKKDQYGMYTSETAKLIGKGVSSIPKIGDFNPADSNLASPRIIDNTIKGYTAGIGQYAVNGIDGLIRSLSGKNQVPLPAKNITEQPPISSFMASTQGGGQIRQDFYDKWDDLSKAEASAKKNNEPFTDPQYYVMKQGKDYMDQLMKQYKLIQGSPNMSPQDKRAKLDSLDSIMNDIARQSLGKK